MLLRAFIYFHDDDISRTQSPPYVTTVTPPTVTIYMEDKGMPDQPREVDGTYAHARILPPLPLKCQATMHYHF